MRLGRDVRRGGGPNGLFEDGVCATYPRASPPSARSIRDLVENTQNPKIGRFCSDFQSAVTFFVFKNWVIKFRQRSHLVMKRSFPVSFVLALALRGYPIVA